jgi:hypothetical protein
MDASGRVPRFIAEAFGRRNSLMCLTLTRLRTHRDSRPYPLEADRSQEVVEIVDN